MHLARISLTHFRNYRQLDLDLSAAITLLQGDNAQGKTNLLEAIYYLATSKPVHAQTESEVVGWQAADEPIPYSRITATLHSAPDEKPLELEIVLSAREEGVGFRKQVRINGVNKRSMDLVGLLRAVLFLPEDTKLIAGGPSERRRYLDIALCQVDRQYCRTLSAYQKVLAQRNGLLKRLREQGAAAGASTVEAQLSFWDEQLVSHGSQVVARRHNFIRQLGQLASTRHRELVLGGEMLTLEYVPSFNPGHLTDPEYLQLKDGRALHSEGLIGPAMIDAAAVGEHYRRRLQQRRAREIGAGITLYGPHRDEMRFLADRRDLRVYGSRGQQRTAALSTKLAEVQTMKELTGAPPLLLLDDVMSELDAKRRSTLLAALEGVDQAILTTTDWQDFTAEFRRQAQLFHVAQGSVASVRFEEG